MLMIDTTTISIICWAIPDFFNRIGCDVFFFFHGIKQVFANWQAPTIFSASDRESIINNFLSAIHEVNQPAERGCPYGLHHQHGYGYHMKYEALRRFL